MPPLDDFEQLKRRVADATRKRDMAAGELTAAETRLRDEFGCPDVLHAKKLLATLEAQERQQAAEYAEARVNFDELYGYALTQS